MAVVDDLTRYRAIYALLCQQEDGSAKTSSVFEFISAHVPDEKVMTVIEAINAIDANGDGTLSFMEFKRGFPKVEKVLGQLIDPTPPPKGTPRGRSSSANLITTEQLLAIQKYFHDIDSDRSGTIDPEEMKAGLANLSPEQSIYVLINNSLDYMDVDGDGLVSFCEFLKAIRKGAMKLHAASAPVEVPKLDTVKAEKSPSTTKHLSARVKSGAISPRDSPRDSKREDWESECEKLKNVIKERDSELKNVQRQLDIKEKQMKEELQKRDVVQMELDMIRSERQYDGSRYTREIEELQLALSSKQTEIELEREKALSVEKAMDEMGKLLSEENQELTLLLTQEKERNNELTHLYETTALDLKSTQAGNTSTNLELEGRIALLISTTEETKLIFQKSIQAEQEAKEAYAAEIAQLNNRNAELQKALAAGVAERNTQSNEQNKEIKILKYQMEELGAKLAVTSERVDSKKRKIREMKQRKAQEDKEKEESFQFAPATAVKMEKIQNDNMNEIRNVPIISVAGAANMDDITASSSNNDDGDISDLLADIMGEVGFKNNNNASDGDADEPKSNNSGINSPVLASIKKLQTPQREEFSIMSVMRRYLLDLEPSRTQYDVYVLPTLFNDDLPEVDLM